MPKEEVDVPERAWATCYARTPTSTLPTKPRAERTVGVGVTRVLLPTRSAVTSTLPRSTMEAMGRGATIAEDRGGVPGVGQVLLPPRSGATPDTPQGGRRMDVERRERGGDGRGRVGQEGAFTHRALSPPPFPQPTLDTFIGSTTTCSRAPVFVPIRSYQLVVELIPIAMCAPIANMSVEFVVAMAAATSRS